MKSTRCQYCQRSFQATHGDTRYCKRMCAVHARVGWRRLILSRDDWRCQVCKVLQDRTGKPLAPHLLVTLKLAPSGPGSAENLVAACRVCARLQVPEEALADLVESARDRNGRLNIPNGLIVENARWDDLRAHGLKGA